MMRTHALAPAVQLPLICLAAGSAGAQGTDLDEDSYP
jgi:hypothetical protein